MTVVAIQSLGVGGSGGIGSVGPAGPAGATGPAGPAGPSSAPAVQGVPGTNLGATQTVDFVSTPKEIWIVGTLNANLTVTTVNRVAGARSVLVLTQDGTGQRTLTISDATSSAAITISADIGASTLVELKCPDANTTDVSVTSSSVGDPAMGGDLTGTASNAIVNTVGGGLTPLTAENDLASVSSPLTSRLNLGIDLTTLAPIDSPTFTGFPRAVTPPTTESSTKLATCAFVQANDLVGVQGAVGTNLGTTQTIDFASNNTEKWLTGILNANLAVTVTNSATGSRARLLLTQDGTGSRTVTVNGTTVSITATAGALSVVEITCISSTSLLAWYSGGTTVAAPGPITPPVIT